MLLTGFSLGCITLTFVVIARDFKSSPVAWVFLALLVACTAFLVRDVIPPEFGWLAGDVMTMTPAIFWLLCQLTFSRRPRLISIWGALALYSFVAPAITRAFDANHSGDGLAYLLGWRLPSYSEYVTIVNGLWVIVANWRDDLIESRRQLRAVLLVSVGLTALLVTISLNTGHGQMMVLPIVVAITVVLTSCIVLQGRAGVLLEARLPANISHGEDSDHSQNSKRPSATQSFPGMAASNPTSKLILLMENECYYRTEKLTLKMVSEKIGIPEYKTRNLINETFGYRNFNDYVNQLRIEEASERLIREPDTPIQNIALDVGYRTLSSFNRAFKEILEQTPSDYRQSKLAEQMNDRQSRSS